jgi:hypothetical protein
MVRKMTFYCGRGLWHPSYEQFYYHLMTTKSRFVAYKFEQKCVEVYRSSAENQSLLRTFNLRAIEVAHRDLRLAVSASAPPAPAPAPASASASDESAVRHNKVIGSGQAHGGGGISGDGNRGVVIGGVEAINDDHHGDANAPANIGNINHVTNENTHDKDNGNSNNSSDSSNNNGNQHQVLQPNSDGRVTLQHGSA